MAHHEHSITAPSRGIDSSMGAFSAVSEGIVAQLASCLNRDPACLERVDEEGASLLHVAALHGHSQIVEMLLKHGISPNVHSCGSLPLHLAAARGHVPVVTALLAAGSWTSPRESNTAKRDTPLHKASRYGHGDVVQILLASGASANVANCRGDLPHQVAATDDLRQLLQSAAASGAVAAAAQYTDEPAELPPPQAAQVALVDVKLHAPVFESGSGKQQQRQQQQQHTRSSPTGSQAEAASSSQLVPPLAPPQNTQADTAQRDGMAAVPRKVSLLGVLR